MIVGHFAAGLALKPKDNTIPLWVLLLAGQFIDVIGMTLVVFGIETMEPMPGISAMNSMDMYLPYSHSLIMQPVWILVAVLLYKSYDRQVSRRNMAIIALVVASHWILDFISHTPDLPLFFAREPVFGLGLWNSVWGTIAVETLILFTGLYFFMRAKSVKTPLNKIALTMLVLIFLVLAVASEQVPLPESGREKALTALILMVGIQTIAVMAEWQTKNS